MNQLAIADLSAELIMRYYENDYMPFLNHMDDEALWYGPAEGQFLQGREAMIRVWNAEEHSLKFSLGNMEVTHITANPSFCDVLLSYPVTTHYPGNRDITLSQRILLTWCERVVADQNGGRAKEPRILVCHIANLHAKHADDFIYPNKFHEVYPEHAEPPHGKRIHFHGWDRSDYFVLSDTILYISAAHGSKHSEVQVWQVVFALSSQPFGEPRLYPKHTALEGHALRRNRAADSRKKIHRFQGAVSKEIMIQTKGLAQKSNPKT